MEYFGVFHKRKPEVFLWKIQTFHPNTELIVIMHNVTKYTWALITISTGSRKIQIGLSTIKIYSSLVGMPGRTVSAKHGVVSFALATALQRIRETQELQARKDSRSIVGLFEGTIARHGVGIVRKGSLGK